jgi:uncharacterized NAD(P)/FAD-binding protein YdhS
LEADLVIVGGGPAATGVLVALARRPGVLGRLVVVERGDTCGPGLPYGEAADPRHTYGRVPVRRRDKGKALREQFVRARDVLESAGTTVVLQTETTAERLSAGAGCWQVDTDRGRIEASRAVLATGHWHVCHLAHIARAVDWRWDVRRLHAMLRDDEDLVVLGTSQSAIDVALALGARRERVRAGGKVILASRRGLLPSVWGPTNLSSSTRRGATHLEALRTREDVRLSDVLAAIQRDVRDLGGDACSEADPEAVLGPPADGAAVLRRDLATAIAARRIRRELPWQAAVWRSMPPALDIFPRLPAEDRLALAPRWSGFLRHLEAIHVAAAAQLLALVDAGLVQVRALGFDPVITEEAGGVRVCGPHAEIRGHRVLDARGPDPRIDRSDDAFLHSVLASGHAVAARIPFAGAPPTRDDVIVRAGRAHLVTGGLWLDLASFRVRDDAGSTDSLYALGALTQGQLPLYLGLWGIRRGAERIAAHLNASCRERGQG